MIAKDMLDAIKGVTKTWKAEKRKADKQDRVSTKELERMREKPHSISLKDAAFDVMEEAYNKASSNGKYYANARQIMYAARPDILRITGKAQLDDVYFTQTLLKDYLEEHEPNWKVVWDARGHIAEPYTGTRIGLGGIDIKQYIEQWHSCIDVELPEIPVLINTKGPTNRFNNVLFIEKEGFMEILTHARIPERYDIAIMSTKGIPVKAACDLIYEMKKSNVSVFVLHDFDLDGFKIVRSLREGVRLSQGSDVIDLGLRSEDIKELPSETVFYKQKTNPQDYLIIDCDATEDEANFLVESGNEYQGFRGHRVELNAMTSEQLLTWLELKFTEYGVEKYIPDYETLKKGYNRAKYLQFVKGELEMEYIKDNKEYCKSQLAPDHLTELVVKELENNPKLSWDEAVWNIAKNIKDCEDEEISVSDTED